MVTTNQKSITDTHTKDTKKSKHNTGDSYEMTKEEAANRTVTKIQAETCDMLGREFWCLPHRYPLSLPFLTLALINGKHI